MLHLLRPIRRRILSLLRNWRRNILPWNASLQRRCESCNGSCL